MSRRQLGSDFGGVVVQVCGGVDQFPNIIQRPQSLSNLITIFDYRFGVGMCTLSWDSVRAFDAEHQFHPEITKTALG